MCEKTVIQVGQVVAVETARGLVDIARVTGMSSSGDTVDILVLEEFVKEMYVESKQSPTYERIENVRPVISEYVPSQQGWIVLNQDLQTAKNYFEQRALSGAPKERTVEVTAPPPRELNAEALERQYFTPSKSQAFFGAALSVPLSALCYSAFAGARQTYQANPAGEDLLSGQIFRKLVLLVTAAGSVSALVVGCALLLYALSKTEESVG
ncbi:hypothetical protein BWQ96_05591 [Gracilariopsis chorda]|uniref:Uncharacterized protein n=1 Tax=Gracilariopsis chorda TaxID=448386 RepID=A0A2V3IRC6_9FLOR|nr:hypothetical protein BWQ96_05591 [Gracilariopsis chorda]|eukprot:PXF44649.1 hypothetical protein BWQ96_05591 [Gracilariopsis chorda]